ncbi:hypothetical protein AWM70_20005 [Paenibacillus yonginensis]|uniref:Two-component system response regulator n=1 Tax=Paenibacillus yonginensis TaxID=1462996 RepID=A0A1B1N565_9BACL|nr:response regulator [Paenibacillus yonginensis]ANS76580.1 hypothetical protein AWM70_20005 [Paenibacillus yonginensis]
MNVLIIDDEVIIRTGLCTVIDWSELGMHLLPPAESAEEALERLLTERPDIVLTDIRMAGMDGIQLAKEIREKLPDAEIIILTGYDDFGFAQRALRQGVTDYLLKTSDPEEIIKSVMKAKQNLQMKRELKRQGDVQAAALRKQHFEAWLTGNAAGSGDPDGLVYKSVTEWLEQTGVFRKLPDGRPQAMRVLLVGASGWGHDRFSGLMLGAAESQLSELLSGITLLRNNMIIAVAGVTPGWSGERQLGKVISRVRDTLRCDIFAAAGNEVYAAGELRRSYEEALKVYEYRVVFGDRGLFELKDVEDRQGGRTVCSEREESELSSLLMNNNGSQLHDWTTAIVRERLEDPETTPAALQAFLQSIVIGAHRWLDRAKETASAAQSSTGQAGAGATPAISFEPGVVLEDELFKLLLSVMNEFHQLVSDGRYSYIHRAIAYIRNHLGEHLTLQQVAGFVHLNPNHFSEVFKRETGQGFSEFVIRERMQRAANILLTTQKKISEVAGEVGYEDIKYFSQQFKKMMGSTPTEYRQLSGDGV